MSSTQATKNSSRQLRLVALIAALMLFATACGLDSLAESAVESAVERAVEAESGEDIDLDFSDGSLSIAAEDGEMRFDTKTGKFVIVDENGEVIEGQIGLDGTELTIESTEGDLRFNAETGRFSAVGEDGELVTGTLNEEDGSLNVDIQNADGEESGLRLGTEYADAWPADVLPLMPNATVVTAAEIDRNGEITRMITYQTDENASSATDWYNEWTDGWEGTRTTDGTGSFMALTNDGWSTQIIITEQGTGSTVALTTGPVAT